MSANSTESRSVIGVRGIAGGVDGSVAEKAVTVSQALDRSRLKDVAQVCSSDLVAESEDDIPINFEAYDAQELESGLIEQANHAFEQAFMPSREGRTLPGTLINVVPVPRRASRSSSRSPLETSLPPSKRPRSSSSDSYVPSSDDGDDDEVGRENDICQPSTSTSNVNKPASKKRKRSDGKKRGERVMRDDGDEQHFVERRRRAELDEADHGSEVHHINSDYSVSRHVWVQLYKYQRAGVRWLHELHSQYVGGILADEMGLGKTIQVCVFLRSIAQSQQPSRIFKYKGLGPVLIVCPATIMHQWVHELNVWFPLCRVAVLHASGAHAGPKHRLLSKMSAWRKEGSVLITSYSTYTQERAAFLKVDWYCVILDEGHKIRNPDAMVTMSLKELKTPHRLILTGSPMQNNLRELWSLNDFVFPGHLGSLKEFTERFSIPITQGGYANASPLQVRTAYKCACVLRDAILPYMLRRMKKEVETTIQLPEKTEQILFCDITDAQRSLYVDFLSSKQCGNILSGRIDAFAGLITLRKICNHPDLVNGGPNRHGGYDVVDQPEMDFGAAVRSGKMLVLKSLLRLWRKQRQKVLLFSQSRQMLTIMEKFVILEGYNYLRLDGATPIGMRQGLVEQFNANDEIFVFLLTTRVGGLGVNLTGANRVVIYDPDWNPSTDVQARERAWRIGQTRPVTVYRLLSSGTIEEKIYQRQIFKHFLVNKVLADPKQQRFFKTNDLHELFTLGCGKADKGHGTETAAIFASTTQEVRRDNYFDRLEKSKKARHQDGRRARQAPGGKELDAGDEEDESGNVEMELSDERRKELMELAKRIAKSMKQRGDAREGDSNATGSKKRRGLFEGRHRIPYLRKQKLMKQRAGAEEELRNSKQQDEYVLRKLLRGKAGVNSALRHDQIIDGSSTADLQLIEDEAETVAKRAAQVLKTSLRPPIHRESRSLFGTSAHTSIPGATSSSSLLKSIRERKERLLAETGEDYESQASSDEDYPSLARSHRADILPMGDRFEGIADSLRVFFTSRRGRATTEEVLERFKEDISPADSFAFRSILKRLARLQPNTSQWLLKSEYR